MGTELIDFQVVELAEGKVIGKEIRVVMSPQEPNPVPGFWASCLADGTIVTLRALDGLLYPNALVGWLGDYRPSDESFVYYYVPLADDDV